MPDWTAFGAVAGFVLLLVLGLARVTTATVGDGHAGARSGTGTDEGDGAGRRDASEADPDGLRATDDGDVAGEASADAVADDAAARSHWAVARDTGKRAAAETAPTSERAVEGAGDAPSGVDARGGDDVHGGDDARGGDDVHGGDDARGGDGLRGGDDERGLPPISSLALLGNVVVTHGVLSVVLVGAAAMTEVPFAAFGASPLSSPQWTAVAGGVGLGLVLAGANAAVAANLDRFGIEYSESLRTSLAPDSAGGWGLLFVATLPLVAVFEELLFRGVLIGAAAAGTGLSPWWFVLPSSALFAAGHGLQGRGGVFVTGALGAVLGAAFAATGSLLLVVVAHYVVNAVEFATHELLGVDPRAWLAV